MAVPKVYRQALRRLHRVVASYFASRAWVERVDCVVLERSVLEPLLDLERFKGARLEWIKTDMKHWFPYIEELYFCHAPKKGQISTIYLSRIPIADYMHENMTDKKRIARLAEEGIKAVLFDKPDEIPATERDLLRQSALWAQGLSVPPRLHAAAAV